MLYLVAVRCPIAVHRLIRLVFLVGIAADMLFATVLMKSCWMSIYRHRDVRVLILTTDHMVHTLAFAIFLPFMSVLFRALIDQPFSGESSASLNVVGDRATHPVYDHLPVRSPSLPPTQSDAVIRNESAPHYSPGSVNRNLTLMTAMLTR